MKSIGADQWLASLERMYASTSAKHELDLLLATRQFVMFLEAERQSRRFVSEVERKWETMYKQWFSKCDWMRQELQSLEGEIRSVGERVQRFAESGVEIPDRGAFERSKHIFAKIQELDWYEPWADKTDALDLGLLHMERPPVTQTGYMVAHALGISHMLFKAAKAVGADQEIARQLDIRAEQLHREYDAYSWTVKNNWQTSGQFALEQLRLVVSIMDRKVFIDPANLKAPRVRAYSPWLVVMLQYAPPGLEKDVRYWLNQPDTINRDFRNDIEPLIRTYLQQAFTELQALADGRLSHRHLVERYKAKCENYEWKHIASLVSQYSNDEALAAKQTGRHTRYEYEDLLTLHFACYLYDHGYPVHYRLRNGVYEPDLLTNLADDLEPIVVEAKVVGQLHGTKQGRPWIEEGLRALYSYLEKYHSDYGVRDGYLVVFRVGDEKDPMYSFSPQDEWLIGPFTIIPRVINVGQMNKKDAPTVITRESVFT